VAAKPARDFPSSRPRARTGRTRTCAADQMTDPPPIDRLTRRDEPAAVASLAAAFADYPLFPVLCPDPKGRPRVVETFCRFLFRMSARCDAAFGTTDRGAVACAWPPGSEWPSWWAGFRAGGPWLFWRLGWRGARLLTRLESEFDA